jgi:hypothetical protein
MEYYSVIKKNQHISFTRKWMELETIMLNERTKTEKDKYYMLLLSLICEKCLKKELKGAQNIDGGS